MRRIVPFVLITCIVMGIISGCQWDMLKPVTMPKAVLKEQTSAVQTVSLPVNNRISKEIPSLFVQYETRGNNILVECIVTGISFRESDHAKKKQGKMVVWIDGKRSQEASTAAFIIKGLSPGDHKLKLEVVKLNNQTYGLVKEFKVKIRS